MKRTLNLLAAGALVATVALGAPPASAKKASAPPPASSKATGGVVYRNVIGEDLHLAFVAQGTPDDAKGIIVFHNQQTGVSFLASVDCYFQVGDQAQFSGDIVLGDPGPRRIRVVAYDGGQPGRKGDLVRITRRPAENPPFRCDAPNTASRPVVHGTLQVHGPDTPAADALLGRLAGGLPDELPGDEDL